MSQQLLPAARADGIAARAVAPISRFARELSALQESVALYLHIPFCQAKCPYCDFNTYAGMLGQREDYVAALHHEIALAGTRTRLSTGARRRCRTVNFGGGTPSLLTAPQVASLLAAIREAFALDDDAEVSLEANPGALEYGHLDELRAVGVNRLSMGAQSFDAGLLRRLGRIHSPDDIARAFAAARTAGFANLNLDFMYALPGQSLATWSATLERALALAPEHLSLYALIVEAGTPLHGWVRQGRVRPVDDDLAADMYELAEDRLATAGYTHYEISNWARPGYECQHNLTYWQNLPYIGLGAGAHSWYAGHRFAQVRPVREYIARVWADTPPRAVAALPAAAVSEDETITRPLEMAETAMLGLRLVEGLDLDAFAARYAVSFAGSLAPRLADVREYGLVEEQGTTLRLTPRGRLLGNEVFARLLPDHDEGGQAEGR